MKLKQHQVKLPRNQSSWESFMQSLLDSHESCFVSIFFFTSISAWVFVTSRNNISPGIIYYLTDLISFNTFDRYGDSPKAKIRIIFKTKSCYNVRRTTKWTFR